MALPWILVGLGTAVAAAAVAAFSDDDDSSSSSNNYRSEDDARREAEARRKREERNRLKERLVKEAEDLKPKLGASLPDDLIVLNDPGNWNAVDLSGEASLKGMRPSGFSDLERILGDKSFSEKIKNDLNLLASCYGAKMTCNHSNVPHIIDRLGDIDKDIVDLEYIKEELLAS